MTSSQTTRILIISFLTTLLCQQAFALELKFKAVRIEPSCRIDAIVCLGNGVVIAGTRDAHPGYIHKSEDYGATWRKVGDVTGSDYITCLCSGKNGVGYLLTGQKVHVWKTTDYGERWQDLGQFSQASNGRYANAYGMIVTSQGTLLVADAASEGGHIHRSTDQGRTWEDLGRISTHALYRLVEVGDGVIANGWAGRIYKSKDDGATWKDMGKLIDSVALRGVEDVHLEGDFAYLPCREGERLTICSIKNPTKPMVVSSFTHADLGQAAGFASNGNTIYLTSQSTSKLLVIDASDRTALRLVGSAQIGRQHRVQLELGIVKADSGSRFRYIVLRPAQPDGGLVSTASTASNRESTLRSQWITA